MSKKLFCKICFDAKKPEKEYTSHTIKTSNGDVCCPILKTTECRYCHKTGHTLAHCELRNKNNAASTKQADQKPVLKQADQKPVQKTPINKFALLDSDNESEDEEVEEKKVEEKKVEEKKVDDKPQAEPKARASFKPSYERKSTVCERPFNQIFKIIDLSYLAKERERLGQTDPALGNSINTTITKTKVIVDDFNRPDAPRGAACFYTSEEEKQEHRARLIMEHAQRVGKPTFASADEDW
jgi:hypothetical protein